MGGIFTKLGRQVEQFKRTMDAAEAENADYVCTTCEERFAVEPDQCPECGSEEIAPIEGEAERKRERA